MELDELPCQAFLILGDFPCELDKCHGVFGSFFPLCVGERWILGGSFITSLRCTNNRVVGWESFLGIIYATLY
jgi:hypothetical protein